MAGFLQHARSQYHPGHVTGPHLPKADRFARQFAVF